jgi:hypothetical protein
MDSVNFEVIEEKCQRDEIGIHGGFKIPRMDCVNFQVIEEKCQRDEIGIHGGFKNHSVY